jgi:hypothetical protein
MLYLKLAAGIDILAFAAAIAMTFQAWRAHRAVETRQSLAFFLSFLLVSLGLFSRMLTDVLVHVGPPYIRQIQGLGTVIGWQRGFLLVSALLLISAYAMLLLVVEKIKNPAVWLIVFVLINLTIFMGRELYFVAHGIALVLLVLLSRRFYLNYSKRHSTNSLLVLIAFSVLALAYSSSLLVTVDRWWTVVFLAFRVVGYFLLFAVSWRVATQ